MTVAWVLGSTGLLGSAICRTLHNEGTQQFIPKERFSWRSATELPGQIASAVRAFALKASATDRWEIYWAAGIGTMSSSADSFAPETQALSLLINLLESEPSLSKRPGMIIFASSAGAIYAGSPDDIITEESSPAPTTNYADAKIAQEYLIRGFVRENPLVTAVIARISTLYGPGQAAGKRQGLLSHMARNVLRNQPIKIFVPYDTIRDYIDADDAAEIITRLRSVPNQTMPVVMKIVASECPVTIAEIIGIFKRIGCRTPKVIRVANNESDLYSRRVQFRSTVAQEAQRKLPKRLPVGIAQLMRAESLEYARSHI